MTRRKCFISFKTENKAYKQYIQQSLDVDMIDKSLNEPIQSDDEDYIMRVIRERYLSDSTVTIFLIGRHSAEVLGAYEQRYIKRELQASLYNGCGNTRNGILGIVLPEMMGAVYKGDYSCNECGKTHSWVAINQSTVIEEFRYNYYLPEPDGCGWSEDDRYCVLASWDDFCVNPGKFIERAFAKRDSPVAAKVRVRP